MMDEERQTLLHQNGESATEFGAFEWPFRHHTRTYFGFVHVALIISVSINVYLGVKFGGHESQLIVFPELEPLRHVIKHEHSTNHTKYSIYSGPPNDQNIAAWEHLLQPLYFNASDEEILAAKAHPSNSVRVMEGGYIAALGNHELHCLNKLRFYLYSSKFPPNEIRMWKEHLDHCIEVLRVSTMCTGDLSMYTFSWPVGQKAAFLDAHSATPRRCVDWQQLEEWSWKRKIGLAPTLLKPI